MFDESTNKQKWLLRVKMSWRVCETEGPFRHNSSKFSLNQLGAPEAVQAVGNKGFRVQWSRCLVATDRPKHLKAVALSQQGACNQRLSTATKNQTSCLQMSFFLYSCFRDKKWLFSYFFLLDTVWCLSGMQYSQGVKTTSSQPIKHKVNRHNATLPRTELIWTN